MLEPDDQEPPHRLSAVPFAVALVGFLVVVALAVAFLRDDERGVLVRPERVDVVDADTVRALLPALPACERLVRAQFDDDGDRLLLELVSEAIDPCERDGAVEVVAEVTFPEAIGERRVVPGVGRTELPCAGAAGGDVVCGPDR